MESYYDVADDTYFRALMFGDNLTNAHVFSNNVWDKYQELLELLRQDRAKWEVA